MTRIKQILLGLGILLAPGGAMAQSPIEFFLNELARPQARYTHSTGIIQPMRPEARYRQFYRNQTNSGVSQMIASRVSARIGSQWVSTALRIAHIESHGNCRAYNRGAIGVFQVRHPEQFGISAAQARTCAGGIEAGVSHMQGCIAKGARTSAQMMICHNTGSPFARRMERAYRIALAG